MIRKIELRHSIKTILLIENMIYFSTLLNMETVPRDISNDDGNVLTPTHLNLTQYHQRLSPNTPRRVIAQPS